MSQFQKRNAVAGSIAYVSFQDKFVSKSGFVAGRARETGNKAGQIVLPGSPDTVAKWDDFLGPAYRQSVYDTGGDFTSLEGDDWEPTSQWIRGYQDTGQKFTLPAVAGGVARMTSSASSGQTPITGAMSIHGEKNWKADNGGLRMAGRVKIETLAGSVVFFGFTDTGGAEMPIYDTGSAATSTLTPAADAVGFLYSGSVAGAALGRTKWRMVGAKNGTDQDTATTVTPVANVYDALEVVVDKDGNAKFYINGQHMGTMSAAVTATVGLADHFGYAHVEGAAKYVDADWINVSANRDTGE